MKYKVGASIVISWEGLNLEFFIEQKPCACHVLDDRASGLFSRTLINACSCGKLKNWYELVAKYIPGVPKVFNKKKNKKKKT